VKGWSYEITVESGNDVGVTRLEFYDNGTLIGKVNYDVGPLTLTQEFNWRPDWAGTHKLKAVAYDAGGAKATHKVKVKVGRKGQFLTNGGFENGFYRVPSGHVGTGWGSFHTDGRASYGFYDDTWAPVVYEGRHSQLIEINTFGYAGSEADRYAGIYQTVYGLKEGATYRLKIYGMLRALGDDVDREGYNYRVEWGYTSGGNTDWQNVDNWVEIPWDTIYDRVDPGSMNEYITNFEAPSESITLFVRAWKKWGTARKELDVNLDNIKLLGYQ
jgi:hypothetical protein